MLIANGLTCRAPLPVSALGMIRDVLAVANKIAQDSKTKVPIADGLFHPRLLLPVLLANALEMTRGVQAAANRDAYSYKTRVPIVHGRVRQVPLQTPAPLVHASAMIPAVEEATNRHAHS